MYVLHLMCVQIVRGKVLLAHSTLGAGGFPQHVSWSMGLRIMLGGCVVGGWRGVTETVAGLGNKICYTTMSCVSVLL